MTIEDQGAAARAHVKPAGSARKLEHSAKPQTDSADRRTELAAERTYAVWAPTGLAALVGTSAR
jgi:putative membrane protein